MNYDLNSLTTLVINLDRPDIQSVDALFAHMFRDQSAARMATRLLYWFPKARKPGGWVFKSWRDWAAELGLTPAQVKRVHYERKLESFGFMRRLMKANGAPTTHYNLDFGALLEKIAAFLGETLDNVRLLLGERSAERRPKRERRKSAPTPAARADEYVTTDADAARQEAARKRQDAEIAAAVEQIKARIGPDAEHFLSWMQRSANFRHAAVSLAASLARLDADFTGTDAHLKHNYLGELMRVVDSGRGSVDDVLKHWQRRTRRR